MDATDKLTEKKNKYMTADNKIKIYITVVTYLLVQEPVNT